MISVIYAKDIHIPEFQCPECHERPGALNLGRCLECHMEDTRAISLLRKAAGEPPFGKAHKDLLEVYLGRHSIAEVAHKLGISAVYVKVLCHGLDLEARKVREEAGSISLSAMCEQTGYNKRHLIAMGTALHQRWVRVKTGTHRIITAPCQAALLHCLEHLPIGTLPHIHFSKTGIPSLRWSRSFDSCVVCATSGHPVLQRHHSRGRCVGCHNAEGEDQEGRQAS